MQDCFRLGVLGTRLFSWSQNKGILIIRTGDLVKNLNFTKRQEESLLSNMNKNGCIIQIMKGLYLLPESIPANGIWKPSAYRLISVYMNELKAKYQITGFMSFNYYGLDSQVPNFISVYNDKISIIRNIAGQKIQFIKTSKDRIINIRKIKINKRKIILETFIGSLPKIIFDAIYDYKKFGSLPVAYKWLEKVSKEKKFLNEYIKILLKIGNMASIRRSGYILEKNAVSALYLNKIKKVLSNTNSLIPLDPTKVKKGTIDKKWGLIVNE